ncbi:hypothetical protein BLNAU_5971 [Blattamonas nauphoetae]|uniref:Uncharacterized protein n=1 Tax=Blattamonas nauphoetae TaxID=2049346 RepID=A0ABQ9Y5I9_9EUKA|nr:hypothetical protein BLNAU_5971 [Blattamonas nauphoetae]
MDSEDDGWRQQSYMTASSAAHGARLGKKPASQQRLEISPQKSTPIRDSPIIIRPPLEPLQPELDDAPLLTEDSPVRTDGSAPTEGDCCDLVEWLSNAIVEQKEVCVPPLVGKTRATRLFHAAPTRILSSLQHAHKCRVGSPKVACPSTHEQKMLLYRLASVFDQPITETQRLQSSERIAARIPETGLSVGKKLTAQQTRPQSVAVYTKSSSRGNRLYLNNCNVLLKTPVTQGIFSVTVIVLSLSNIVYHAGVVRMGLFDSTAVVHKLSDALGSEVEDFESDNTQTTTSVSSCLSKTVVSWKIAHENEIEQLDEGCAVGVRRSVAVSRQQRDNDRSLYSPF